MKKPNIIVDFIPEGSPNRPGLPLLFFAGITVHDTGNPNEGADALMHARYLKGKEASQRKASWHFTVDDKHIVQHLPLDERAYHAGDGRDGPGNATTISVEICENADGDRIKAERNAAHLVAWLLHENRLDACCVWQHNHWRPTKNCPRVLRETGRWDGFLMDVNRLLQQHQSRLLPWQREMGENAISELADAGQVSEPAIWKAKLGEAVPAWLFWEMLRRIGVRQG